MTVDIRAAEEPFWYLATDVGPLSEGSNVRRMWMLNLDNLGPEFRTLVHARESEAVTRPTPTREQIAKAIFMTDYEHMGPEAWEAARLDGNNDRQDAFMKADAILALLQAQAGRDGT